MNEKNYRRHVEFHLGLILKQGDDMRTSIKAFPRITIDPEQMGGLPCIRGLRMPVSRVVAMVADGMSVQDILSEYSYLEDEDIREALKYAAAAVRERELPVS
jgi:uncharacterized protein (DUF433 family)